MNRTCSSDKIDQVNISLGYASEVTSFVEEAADELVDEEEDTSGHWRNVGLNGRRSSLEDDVVDTGHINYKGSYSCAGCNTNVSSPIPTILKPAINGISYMSMSLPQGYSYRCLHTNRLNHWVMTSVTKKAAWASLLILTCWSASAY